jgi:hypothetical protein
MLQPEKDNQPVTDPEKTELEEYEELTENQIFDDDDFIGGPEEE